MASRIWKDGTRRGIVYVEGRAALEQVMAATGRGGAGKVEAPKKRRGGAPPDPADAALEGAMAVYLDRKGKPFAWQVPFDIAHWDRVAALVEAE